MGGLGICGRELCCKSYLADFVPVSIKMAKEQNLSLNPTKISGTCGRLMCCLKNEQETYEYLNSRLPSMGETVTCPGGQKGEVTSINVLRQLVKVVIDNGEEKELREYHIDELRFQPRGRKAVKLTAEELKELEGLEDRPEDVTEEKTDNRRENNRDNRRENNRDNRRDNRRDDNRENNRDNNRENNGESNRENNKNHRNRNRNRKNFDKKNRPQQDKRNEQ